MKTKVFALILAILCFSMLVVGCAKECTEHVDENKDAKCDVCEADVVCAAHTDADNNLVCDVCGAAITPKACETHTDADANLTCDVCGAALTAPCDTHKDDNADKICDACGKAIVVINQPIAPTVETRVPMVVNTAPADANVATYIHSSPVRFALKDAAKVEYDLTGDGGKYLHKKTEAGENYVYTLMNPVTGEKVDFLTKAKNVTVSINWKNDLFEVRMPAAEAKIEYIYYSYAGEILYTKTDVAEKAPVLNLGSPYLNNGFVKFSIDDKIFVVNPVTDQVIAKDLEAKTFVDMPQMDRKNDKYGYVEKDGVVYVYDLSQWISCVASYELPAGSVSNATYLLENGNVLVQSIIPLETKAVSYDMLSYGTKCDLAYTLIDPAAKTVTPIEFGYLIQNIYQPGADDELYTANALNVARVTPIVNDYEDIARPMTLVIDNNAQVLFDATKLADTTVVGKNLYAKTEHVDAYDEDVVSILNEKGEVVSYVPLAAYADDEWLVFDNAYYTYDMNLLAQTEGEDGYHLLYLSNVTNYALFTKTVDAKTEYYFFNGSSAPVKIDLKDGSISGRDHYGYEITYKDGDKTVHAFYNVNNELVAESENSFNLGYCTLFTYENDAVYMVTAGADKFLVKA